MRDLLITLLVFGAIPWILMRPWVGIIVYSWLSLMNPHRLAYGFAYSFPFAMVAAAVTIVAMPFSKDRKKIPWSSTFVLWAIFVLWLNVTTLFAIYPEDALREWDRTMKIQLMTFVTLLLMHGRQRITALAWVIVVSLGFYGIKGGLFAILTGGAYRVMGPWDTFITDNNTLALALIMTLPLMRYLMTQPYHRVIRFGLIAAVALTGMAILTSHSRGALLAGGTMLLFLIVKSRHKVPLVIASILAVPAMLLSMPDEWFERMGTIGSYEQDASAMGRINAWWFAFNLAKANPVTGGGFDVFSEDLFLLYAPNPLAHHDAHSIYFEILGEHGFIGLALFLGLGLSALRSCSWVVKKVREREDLLWAGDLAAMLQVSLIGYAVGGAFLGLAYYDLYYKILALVMLLRSHVGQVLAAVEQPSPAAGAATDGRRNESGLRPLAGAGRQRHLGGGAAK